MTKPKPLTPLAFTTGLVEHLSHVPVAAIAEAKKFLRERRDLRDEPSDRMLTQT